ncbi:MAG: chromosome segregation protein SMC [Thermogemmatispora sp.]|uniref:chromosome segregation protein SMC n=1 Tax=Thermogemmatispora sp. TaxID=1968838 RepID=UPI0019DBD669|nr:chromosome segregation protein SMC [Thermogemmatispora sp.]MBE3564155.1 chromosome segregation protein SMC [Thermogemmatispora sp.]
MYLKRLELLGFKSFATRTCLEFSPGITAVVGPNGAGKSNIADAIRWVLGEQSMRQLRGRKSEDIIFAGGHGKAALGMAEVSLTIDNSTGWMPSEYSEITVTRRSYRSGENEYLINKQKVRLRDVLLLLAQARIGHDSYTVIGQGLIDAALSLRPEERRSLFEDAAGIRPYQVQRAEAEQRLRQTEGNLQRLHDIVNEIEPRLGPLEEQARRAREYAQLQEELRQALVSWYQLQWRRLQATATRAEAAESEQATRLRQLEQAVAIAERQRGELLHQRQEIQQHISAARRAAGEANGQLQRLERELAVAEERITGLQRQREEQQRQERQLRERLITTQQRLTDLEEAREQAREALDEAAQTLATLEATIARVQKDYELDERRLRAAQNDLIQTQARLGSTQTELGRQQKHLGERNRALAARREALAQAQQALRSLETRLAEQRSQLQVARDEEQQLTQRKQALQRSLQEAQQELERLKGLLAEAERARRSLADRLAMLRTWQRNLSGYSEGVRALLRAPHEQMPGLLAPLPRLVLAPAGLERAIEAALGEALQGVVVTTRAEAERCLAYLERSLAGRALLLWLQEEADPSGSVPVPPAFPSQAEQERAALEQLLTQSPALRPAVLGLAWQLVECEDQYQPLCYRLLSGVLLVEDLTAAFQLQTQARAFADRAGRPLRALVTRKGEILSLQSGWLSGGNAQGEQNGGLLHYERELRELPAQLEEQKTHIDHLNTLMSEIQRVQEGRRAEQAALEREIQKNAARLQELGRALANSEREQERLQTELKLATSVEQQLAAEIAGLEQEVQATRERVQAHERAQQELQGLVEELQAQVEERATAYRRQQEELGRLRTQMAVKRQEAKTLERQVSEAQEQQQELRSQLEQQQQRLRQAEEQQQRLHENIARQRSELEQAREQARQAGLLVQQREQALRELEQRLTTSEQELATLRQEHAQCEILYRRCLLDSQRARDSLEALQSQLQEDLGLSHPQELIHLIPQAGPGEAESMGQEGDEEATLRRLRRQIEQARSRLKALGGCDPDAPRQYEEERQRFEFLSAQIADMEQAAQQLHTIISQLDATMTRQFETTFEAVNARFREHFRTLFNGGQARLELVVSKGGEREGSTERSSASSSPGGLRERGHGHAARNGHGAEADEEAATPEEAVSTARSGLPFGVEVIVQPPGKKVQDLSLLSGGERALVSAALLFSLLEINPPPFCLLDEVDAALDESNVSRFCDILKRLAERTQFIVITHNRVTMTAAQAIYGVSMGSDSVSRLASLRLSEAETVVARQRSG